jgi:hypothetical protein
MYMWDHTGNLLMIYNRYTNLVTFCEIIWKIKNTTVVGTVPKFNWEMRETETKLDIPQKSRIYL